MMGSGKGLPVGKIASKVARRVVAGTNGDSRNGLQLLLSTRSGLGGGQGANTRLADAGPPKKEVRCRVYSSSSICAVFWRVVFPVSTCVNLFKI